MAKNTATVKLTANELGIINHQLGMVRIESMTEAQKADWQTAFEKLTSAEHEVRASPLDAG